ncbi:MAG: hypothetical protein ABJA64_03140 [Candidatus Saccharibacteria bacterium]
MNEILPTPQSVYYDHLLNAAEDFDALPLSSAFDMVINKYLLDERVRYITERGILIDADNLSKTLLDTFFFPEQSELSDLRIELVSDVDKNWSFGAQFKVDDSNYLLSANDIGATISGTNINGDALECKLPTNNVIRLLACIVNSEAAKNPQAPNDPAVIPEKLSDNDHSNPREILKKLLITLGNLNGRVVIRRNALLPCEEGNRALVAKFTETESPRLSGIVAELELDWEIFNPNTEIKTSLREVRAGEVTRVRFGELGSTLVPVEDYLITKQIPELSVLEENASTPKAIEPGEPAWLNLAATYMATIGPLMKEFRHLDEN